MPNRTTRGRPRSRSPSRGQTTRRSPNRRAQTQRKHPGLISGFFKLVGFAILGTCLLGAVALGVYMLELDRKIHNKFEGKRWALPARVYARPLEVFAGMRLSSDALIAQLNLIPYHKLDYPQRPGTYSQHGQAIDIYTRAFAFWDGTEQARKVRLTFNRNTLQTIRSLDNQPPPTLMRLEPAEIASIYPTHGEDRILVKHEQLPSILVDALIAVEDRSYYNHFGIDLRGISRAFVANLRAGRIVQGGSTLTQQLVKNFFLSNERSYARKINEILMALLIEWRYDKNEILEAYANEVNLGQDGGRSINGLGLASQFYFNRALDELDLHHVALLVGLVKGPSKYDPHRHPQAAKQRRALVLNIMAQQNLISRRDAQIAQQMPLEIVARIPRANSRYPAFLDLVRRHLRENYREQDLTSEGLKIFTTLDPNIQEAAEQSLITILPKLEKKARLETGLLQAAMIVADNQTGELRAIVGGRDVRLAGFNRAISAQRPAGSLLKPAVYLTALENPEIYTLATMLDDVNPLIHTTYDGTLWEPQNYDKKMHGWVMLRDALAKSHNIPTARLGLDLDLTRVVKTLKRLGLDHRNIPPYPSLVLGSLDVSPLEVAQIYSAFASGGYRLPLRTITEVTAANGKPLPRLYSLSLQQAIDAGPAYLIISALQKVVQSGTASAAGRAFPNLGLAGKTGTTDELRDSWFAGFSGNILSVAWVGRDDNQPAGLSGSKGALPLWIDVMRRLPLEPLQPHEPADVEQILIDPRSGQLANNSCRGAEWMPFLTGSEPRYLAPCAGGGSTSDETASEDSLGSFFRRLLE